ncbi:MAG: hypothetical protein E7613_10035 [Ruminococcaceae bacterium]|nr:hypothetical protein [Oscillospiraceae bacterium]
MKYIGKWKLHSIGITNEKDEFVYATPEEYLASPMPYIDETDEEAVEDEMRERKSIVGMEAEICDDGFIYFTLPISENIPKEEVDEAVKSGEITLRDGKILGQAFKWELRGDELWYDTEIEGEVFGEAADSWAKGTNDDGYLTFMTMRFVKE